MAQSKRASAQKRAGRACPADRLAVPLSRQVIYIRAIMRKKNRILRIIRGRASAKCDFSDIVSREA